MSTFSADGLSAGRQAESVGRLLVVGTPIGNLEDITYRAVRVLGEVPLVLAEDTRHTRKLFNRYGIHTRLVSYHQHNKRARLHIALDALEDGDVALVSSAGMPSISDPGFELITAAVERGYEVDVVPGPSAVVTAVVGAAIPAPGFLFAGFLPRGRAERRRRLGVLANTLASLVLYESPHRLLATLIDAAEVLGDRPLVLGRELTKIHEEFVRGTLLSTIDLYRSVQPQGEFTLVIGPPHGEEPQDCLEPARETVQRLRKQGQDRRTALATVEEQFGISRNEAYRLWLEIGEAGDMAAGDGETEAAHPLPGGSIGRMKNSRREGGGPGAAS